MNAAASRINLLAEALEVESYLEIGVATGATFDYVKIARRFAVDPRFSFDPATRENPTTSLFRQSSDEFFLSQPLSLVFDIIFIDGLHVFEQVLRDFHNAILHSHDRSVIILDDTKPSDVFSALPDADRAIKFRTVSGDSNGNWHGDVFKIVFYIHDFWQCLNFATVVDVGNPQTIVWRSNSKRKSCFNDLEKISRMNYFDLCDNIAVMHETSEKEAVALCLKELSKGA